MNMRADSFSITSDYLHKEIVDINNFIKKVFFPKFKKEVLELYEQEYKDQFEHVVLCYDGKNQSIANYFPKSAKIETQITFDESKNNELIFNISGTNKLFDTILDKQNKGTASGIVSKEEIDFFMENESNIKRTPRSFTNDKYIYLEDFYVEKNYYYEPTFNDIKFAERVEKLFNKFMENFTE